MGEVERIATATEEPCPDTLTRRVFERATAGPRIPIGSWGSTRSATATPG